MRQKNPKNANSASPEIAKLCGVRFAYAPEIPAGREFDLATFKALSGGDKITCRPMYQSPFVFDPTFKLLLSGQYFIKVENAHDVGFLRRFVPVKFNQEFTGSNADIHLKSKLRTAEEISGIFNILAQECLNWQVEGLIVSPEMEAEKQNYLSENDFIASFIEDNCTFDSEGYITRKTFLDRLKREKPTARRFSDPVLTEIIVRNPNIGYKRRGENGAFAFCGIRFNDEVIQNDIFK